MVAAFGYCIKTDKVCSGKPPENLPLCDLPLKLIPTVETETETKRFGNCYGAGTFEAVIDAIGSMAPRRFSCAAKAYAADLLMQAGLLTNDPKTTHSHNEIRQHLLFLVYTDRELLYV